MYTPTPPLRLLADQSGAMIGERNMELADDIDFIVSVQPQPPCVYQSENGMIEPMAGKSTHFHMPAGFRGDYPPFRGADLGAVPHDFIYGDAEKIAAAWGWSLEHVLDWANDVFNERMEALGADPAIREVCYELVSLAGYPYHEERTLGFWKWAVLIIGERLETPTPRIGSDT